MRDIAELAALTTMDLRILALIGLAACNTEALPDAAEPDAGSNTSTATLTATWQIENLDGSTAPCATGYETMKITVDGVNEVGVADGNPTSSLFPCAAGTAEVTLAGGFPTYGVSWHETTASGDTSIMRDVVSSTSLPALRVMVVGGRATAHTVFYPHGGWAWIEWSLYGTVGHVTLSSCADAGIDRVEIKLTDDQNAVTTVTSQCGDIPAGLDLTAFGSVGGAIHPLAPGQYAVDLTAFAGSQAVGTSTRDTISITDNNSIDLSGYPIAINLTNR